MADVADMCGIYANRQGYARCPFHDEKSASLRFYDHNYYCFGCHAGGDAVDFVARFYGIRQNEALQKINDAFDLGLPIDRKPTLRQHRQDKKRATVAEIESYLDGSIKAIVTALESYWMFMYTEADKMSQEYHPDDPVWVEAIKNKPLYAEQWRKWEQEARRIEDG